MFWHGFRRILNGVLRIKQLPSLADIKTFMQRILAGFYAFPLFSVYVKTVKPLNVAIILRVS